MSRRLTLTCLLLVCLCVVGCTDSSQPSSQKGLQQSSGPEKIAGTETTPEQTADADSVNQTGKKPDSGGELSPSSSTDAPNTDLPPAESSEKKKSVDELIADATQQANDGDFDAAAKIAEGALQKEPKHREVLVLLARLYFTQGAQKEQEKEVDASRPFYRKFTAIMRTLNGTFKELESVEQQMLGFALYKEAADHAFKGDSVKALSALSDSFAAGFEALELIEDDKDLKSLRELPEFKTLLTEQREKMLQRFQLAIRMEMQNQEPFPFDFSLPDPKGKMVSLRDLKGKVVIVDFWGTWCPPCREEIPHFVELKEKYSDQGFEIVGINYENGPKEEIIELIKQFHATNQMNYPCVIGDKPTQDQVPNLEGFPTTLFIDREGTVRLKEVGYQSLLQLEAAVKLLLEEELVEASPSQ